MKIITPFIVLLLFSSCNQQDSLRKSNPQIADTSTSNHLLNSFPSDSAIIKPKEKIDTVLLMNVSEEILTHFKIRNYERIAQFIHPKEGLRFSPYAHIDTTKDKILSAAQFLQQAKQNDRLNWNSSWDGEKPEFLTIDGYFKEFIYDVDFLNAKLKSINQYHSQGTDLNNINEVYPGCNVVEFFFPGFEKKYGGLDFRALRLIYRIKNNKTYLVGIVHDQWTP